MALFVSCTGNGANGGGGPRPDSGGNAARGGAGAGTGGRGAGPAGSGGAPSGTAGSGAQAGSGSGAGGVGGNAVDGSPAGGDDGAAGVPDAPNAGPPPPGACAKLFGTGAISEWVHYDAEGKLVYKPLNASGDRIMDFSHAGYMGGGVPIPTVPVAVTIGPSGADDTAAIQAAIDMVARMPLVNGFRGAVLLRPGAYRSASTINITASGVVLRGSGSGDGGTVIDLTATSHVAFRIRGTGTYAATGTKVEITDDHVSAGATSFSVSDASSFKVGDPVLVARPVTAAWVSFMGMDRLVRGGSQQTWIAPGSQFVWERRITALAGNRVTIDVPLSDSFAGRHVKPPGASMQKYTFDGRISQVGLEQFKVIAPKRTAVQANDPTDHGGNQFAEISAVSDSWVRRLAGHNTVEGIHFEGGSSRITVEDTVITHEPTDYFTASAPFDYNVNGGQILIQRSASKGGNKIMMYTTHRAMGPNVLLDFDADGDNSHIQPHLRWATGLLIDNAVANSPGTGLSAGIGFMDRGTAGSGHGWSIGWGVAWNCQAPGILMQLPPGSMNMAIGCKGVPSAPTTAPGGSAPHPNGIFESLNTPVTPRSLYLAQLCERLGPQALANIGYPLQQ